MLQSRKDELDELEDELDIEEDEIEGGDEGEDLSISDLRARRKARKQQGPASVDEDEPGSAVTGKKETRTRSREEALLDRERQAQGRGENIPVLGAVVAYFRGVVAEIQKVTWPTREEAWRLTRIVLGVTVIFSIVLGSVDLFYGQWFKLGIDNTGTFILIAIPVVAIAGSLSWYFVFREEAS